MVQLYKIFLGGQFFLTQPVQGAEKKDNRYKNLNISVTNENF